MPGAQGRAKASKPTSRHFSPKDSLGSGVRTWREGSRLWRRAPRTLLFRRSCWHGESPSPRVSYPLSRHHCGSSLLTFLLCNFPSILAWTSGLSTDPPDRGAGSKRQDCCSQLRALMSPGAQVQESHSPVSSLLPTWARASGGGSQAAWTRAWSPGWAWEAVTGKAGAAAWDSAQPSDGQGAWTPDLRPGNWAGTLLASERRRAAGTRTHTGRSDESRIRTILCFSGSDLTHHGLWPQGTCPSYQGFLLNLRK